MRPYVAWGLWALGVALASLALLRLTQHTTNIETARKLMMVERRQGELVRTAIWRLESAALPLVAKESLAFHSKPDEFVRMHLRLESDGRLNSPEVAEGGGPSPTRARLEDLRRMPEFLRALREIPFRPVDDTNIFDNKDFNQRYQNSQQVTGKYGKSYEEPEQAPLPPMIPLWAGNQLVLARRIADRIEVSLIDIERLYGHLADLVRDIYPQAKIQRSSKNPDLNISLASLPLSLECGPHASLTPELETGAHSALNSSMLLAWGGLVFAALSSGLLLFGALRLSERRRDFVTAVTHELRTPLTSLQLHSDLLADGRTPPEKREAHIGVVREAAGRLAHLVENVLSYSRLERSRRGRMEHLTLDALLERPLQTIRERMAGAGFAFTMETEPEACAVTVDTDAEAVSRIILNLADNALKYAFEGRSFSIHIRKEGGYLKIRCADAGPGIPRGYSPSSPFRKSAQQAAHSAPGVGLGLPMSVRLAKVLGGTLTLDHSHHPGACWELKLPIAGT